MKTFKLHPLLLIILLISIGIFLWVNNQPLDNDIQTQTSTVVNSNKSLSPEVINKGVAKKSAEQKEINSNADSQNSQVTVDDALFNKKMEEQQIILKERFLAKIKLNMELPGSMHYQEVTLADGVTGIHGTPYTGDDEFLLLTNNKKNTLEDLKDFLKEEKETIPIVHNLDFSITDKVEKIPLNKVSGLEPANIVLGYDHNGVQVYTTLLNRADGNGSYIVIMKASKKYFEDNEENNAQWLNKLKAIK